MRYANAFLAGFLPLFLSPLSLRALDGSINFRGVIQEQTCDVGYPASLVHMNPVSLNELAVGETYFGNNHIAFRVSNCASPGKVGVIFGLVNQRDPNRHDSFLTHSINEEARAGVVHDSGIDILIQEEAPLHSRSLGATIVPGEVRPMYLSSAAMTKTGVVWRFAVGYVRTRVGVEAGAIRLTIPVEVVFF